MEHMIRCASMVAYLEGLHRLEFPDNTHDFTLPNLERRVAALERAVGGITAPPPHEAYSWNGIVWRLWRAEYKSQTIVSPYFDDSLGRMAGMLDADDYTTAGLRRVVDRLGYDLPELKCPREEEAAAAAAATTTATTTTTQEGECEACLLAVVQKLSYVGGRFERQPPMKLFCKGTIYAFAACLGHELEKYGEASTPGSEATTDWVPSWTSESAAATGRGDIAQDQAFPTSARNGRCPVGPGVTLDERHSVKTWGKERLSISAIPEGTGSIRTGIMKTLSANIILKLENTILKVEYSISTSFPPPGSITIPAQGWQSAPISLETRA